MVTLIEMFESPGLIPLDFCLWGSIEKFTNTRKGEYTRWITNSHFGCCCPHKETCISTQTNNTRSLLPWIWDRKVVPKRRYRITTVRCVISQRRADLITVCFLEIHVFLFVLCLWIDRLMRGFSFKITYSYRVYCFSFSKFLHTDLNVTVTLGVLGQSYVGNFSWRFVTHCQLTKQCFREFYLDCSRCRYYVEFCNISCVQLLVHMSTTTTTTCVYSVSRYYSIFPYI
jgi:hypothetical protein